MDRFPIKCIGGPLDGRVLPVGAIPFVAWIPRARMDDPRPMETLPADVVFDQPHYRYSGVSLGHELHVYQGAI